MKCEKIFGIPIAVGTRADIIAMAHSLVGMGGVVCTPNAEIMDAARRDEEYGRLLREATLNVPDGISVVRAMRRRGFYTEKVSGVELGETLLSHGHTFAVIGGKEGVALRAGLALSGRYPKSRLLFSRSGYGYRVSDIKKQLARYTPDIVLVCLGASRQEFLIDEIRCASPNSLYLALGGAVDVYAGDKSRAPAAFIQLGLEWLWRIMKEPVRIKKIPSILRFAVLSKKG